MRYLLLALLLCGCEDYNHDDECIHRFGNWSEPHRPEGYWHDCQTRKCSLCNLVQERLVR